jgi:ribosomal protein S18 acetylase RimI-like enzyme
MTAASAARAQIRPIASSATHPLRQAVLRPHQELASVSFPGDEAADTLHVGAFGDGVLIAVASVCREAPAGPPDRSAWRLRGMATDPAQRRSGHGRALVHACIEHAQRRGAAQLWCNARLSAADFYRALGFQEEGDPFELPEIGPHLFMRLPLTPR